MRRPSFLSQRPLLLLLLSPWPVWTQTPAAASRWGTQGAPHCPEACACAPGGQANCSGRALLAVPAGLSRPVRALLLDHNRVRALPPGAFVGAGALLRLDLRENGLRWVHARAFWGLGALQELDLGANQLEALVPGTFAPLRALRVLSLADNQLARLEPAALGALPLLGALSLQDNDLSALAPGLLAGLPALNTLGLRGNPWACGCALRPLCAWLRRHPRPAPEAETLLCVSPGRLTLSPLTAFSEAAFSHCGQPLAPRDLAVVYALGPLSFLASLAACMALGSVFTACRARRRRRRRRAAAARCPPRRLPDPSRGPASPADPGSTENAAAQA
ncbi:leucine-rich repeat-containing protein 26 [Camelus ferus]|uniref:Leucine-rich repeat-containing protein 26 n=1 Tax=Camelus ferus TaxID=419612 RepID=A0A8B8SXZ4_CAMFR|nr:leucine-rich repeat-containing protein 26 [Camelus ferus]